MGNFFKKYIFLPMIFEKYRVFFQKYPVLINNYRETLWAMFVQGR